MLWALTYSIVTRRIISTAVQSIEELAMHDEQAIESNLRDKVNILKSIALLTHQCEPASTEDLLESLSRDAQMIDCIRLTLVAESGDTLSNNWNISKNPEMLLLCQNSGDTFVARMDNPDAESTGRGEVLLLGITFEPLTVEGNTYRYLVARLHISAFEKDLKIDSYNGRGYSSVIDADGSYIVNVNRSYTAQVRENFYDRLRECTLLDGVTVEQVQERLAGQESFTIEYLEKNNERRVIFFDPMPDLGWIFVTAVPWSVFEHQSLSLIKIFALLMTAVLAAVLVAVVVVFRRREKMLAVEQKHHTELAEALQLAEQANRAKTTFLNNMSHDIRTPMNAIIGFTTLALTHLDNQERLKDYLNKISKSSNHLLSLINDVLDMSRIESGKVTIEEKPENLAEILHSLRDIVQADIHAKQLEFFIDTVEVTDEDIYCDKLRLNQILLNILSNAMKFTPPGGTVSVRITEKPSSLPHCAAYEFRVKDTGIGMSPEFIQTIFEPFTRERTSTVSGIQGTGLGMSITKNIVDMMNGTITVESEVSKGSEFIVTLDLRLQADHREIEPIPELKGLRALVVDDDMNACQSVAQMLRQMGMASEWTMYGKEAVARTEEALRLGNAFRVYTIDWLMPDMNGVETARRIRKMLGEDAYIILLSAYDWADAEAEAREAGVSDFITKPLFPSDMRQSLLRACGKLPSPAHREVIPAKNFRGKRILLTEDNELNREIATEILQEAGFVVESVENGKEAVETVRAAQPGWYDAVLMDIQMPIMDGYTATRAIRALPNPALAQLPIIAMTANAFDEDRRAAQEAGMNAHVAKPIDIPVLLETLEAILE
ncbi:MAG: response regulator [Oscillospiraceae bacterium]|nr:response regulator [Oscillospiraceae bacterium]